MSFHHSPKIVTDGLVFCIDPANPKSYSTGSTCRDLTLKNGVGTLTNVTLSSDKGFIFSTYNSSKIQFIRNFTNVTNNMTYMIAVDAPPPFDTYGALLSSSNINYGGIVLGYYYGGVSICGIEFYAAENDGSYAIDLITPININFWKRKYIIAATINGSVASMYIDGILTATVSNPYNLNNQNYINVGYDDQEDNFTVEGTKIYQSMIYNRALTDTEILQNYNALKGKYKI
jgi:hypothetical protein